MSSRSLGFGDGFSVNAYTNVPAIIEKAVVKNNAYYKNALQEQRERFSKEHMALAEQWRLSGSWREEFSTWDEACRSELEITASWFYRLVKVKQKSDAHVVILPPTQVKDNLSSKEEAALKQVEKAREEKPATTKSKTEPEPAIVDKVGREVPAYALEYWRRSSEVQHVLSALSDLRTTIRKANESGDRLWCAFDTQDLLLSFDALYTSVSNFMPYAVCKKCNGVETKTLCSMCHGTGLINKTTYGFNKS